MRLKQPYSGCDLTMNITKFMVCSMLSFYFHRELFCTLFKQVDFEFPSFDPSLLYPWFFQHKSMDLSMDKYKCHQ